MATFWQHPAVVALLVGIPAMALGLLGFIRSLRVDKVAKQAGIATDKTASIGQVVAGLNAVITALQNDNKVLRDDVEDLKLEVKELTAILKAKNA